MKILVDTHTHTLASGHAYNTINEMATAAKEKGLEILCITEHGPKMPGSCHSIYFTNLKVVNRRKYGIELMMGIEANIIHLDGTLDVNATILQEMDICIASLHPPCVESGTIEENTSAYVAVMRNPYVHVIGHPDDSRYPVDYERMARAAKEYKVALEVNNHSLSPNSFRHNARENVMEMLKQCKKYKVPITMASDAHTDDDVGNFVYVLSMLEELQFPKELILNHSINGFKGFLVEKGVMQDKDHSYLCTKDEPIPLG